MDEKLNKRQKQALETKRKIEEIGIQLFNENGFNDVTIQDICKEAGVSIGTFYYYYESKIDIFNKVFEEIDHYYEEEVSEKIKKLDVLDALTTFFQEYADFITGKKIESIKRLYFSETKLFIDKERPMRRILTEALQKGLEQKVLKSELTSEEMASYLFLIARGVVNDWCLHDGEYDLKEKINFYVGMQLRLFT